MVNGSVARRWAKALFLLAEQENQLNVISREMERVVETWKGSEELQTALQNPMLGREVRFAIFTEVVRRLSVCKTMENFLRLLNDKRRLMEIPAIAREFQVLADGRENLVRAEVIGAAPVAETVAAGIQATLEAATRKKVVVTRKVDASLLGGIVTRVGGLMYDGSIRTQLNRIKEDLKNGQPAGGRASSPRY